MSDDLVETELSDFSDAAADESTRDEQSATLDNHGDTLARDVERNAADIEHLIDIVGSVSEQMSDLVETVQDIDDVHARVASEPAAEPNTESQNRSLPRGYY